MLASHQLRRSDRPAAPRPPPALVPAAGCMLVLAQLPNFHDLAIVSAVGSLMPIIYSGIALISIIVHGPEPGRNYDLVRGSSDFKTAMSVLGGLGSMFFAFGGQASAAACLRLRLQVVPTALVRAHLLPSRLLTAGHPCKCFHACRWSRMRSPPPSPLRPASWFP